MKDVRECPTTMQNSMITNNNNYGKLQKPPGIVA